MDILISWQQLWMMMLLILGGYYLIILFLYYRKELNGVLNGRYRFFSRLVDPGEDLQSGDSEPVSTSNKSKVKVDEA
ncbi:hypothetical protein, partial [Niabella terrae]